MTEVALASGFASLRRFNETFQQLYRRPPGDLRRRAGGKAPVSGLSLLLPYRPPYDWRSMVRFLEARALPGFEIVWDQRYVRVVELGDCVGSVEIAHAEDQSALRAIVRFPRLDLLPQIIARIRRLFDLGADPSAIGTALARDPQLAPLVAARPGLRVPGAWDAFEIAVRAMLGQQITVKAATRLGAGLVAKLGTPIGERAGLPGLTHGFPRPDRFDAEAIAALGMPRARAAAIAGLAAAALADPRLFDPRRDLDDAVARLRRWPGVGEWTAQYIAMRALRESDAFLAGDVALQRALAADGRRLKPRELLARAELWRPWRAYAVLHLWMADSTAESGAAPEETANALAA